MTKNDFALKCLEQLNEFGSNQPSSAPLARTNNFDENGERMFIYEEEPITSNEMIDWFNITFHDPDNAADDMITEEMTNLHIEGVGAGFITDETPKYW